MTSTIETAAITARSAYWASGTAPIPTDPDNLDGIERWQAVVEAVRASDAAATVPTAIESARDHLVQSEDHATSATRRGPVGADVFAMLATAEAVQAATHALLAVVTPGRSRYADMSPVARGAHEAIDAVLSSLGLQYGGR